MRTFLLYSICEYGLLHKHWRNDIFGMSIIIIHYKKGGKNGKGSITLESPLWSPEKDNLVKFILKARLITDGVPPGEPQVRGR